MKSPRSPFRINIGFLINQPPGYSRVIPLEFQEYEFNEGFIAQEISGTIELVRTQDGFRALSDIKAGFNDECGRCLEPFTNMVHASFEEFFTFPYVDSSEDEIRVPEDGNVDFQPILYDYLLMGRPINPVCKEDCLGLCGICGENLNHRKCVHHLDGEKEVDAQSASAEGSSAA